MYIPTTFLFRQVYGSSFNRVIIIIIISEQRIQLKTVAHVPHKNFRYQSDCSISTCDMTSTVSVSRGNNINNKFFKTFFIKTFFKLIKSFNINSY